MTGESRRELPLPRVDGSVPLPDDLDVAGGWGYSREDRCVLLDFGDEGAGVPCEYEFIPRRIRQERLRMPDAERFFDFRWERVRQRLVVDEADGSRFDVLEVHVSAVAKDDMAALKEAFMRHAGAGPEFQKERARLAWVAVREFWFDLGMLDFPYEMHVLAMERSEAMAKFEVKMGRPGGGSGTFVVVVHASTQDQARRSAEAQNPGYKAQAVRPRPLGS